MNKAAVIVLFILIGGSIFFPAYSAKSETTEPALKTITMAFTIPQSEPYGKWMYLVFKEAFERIGLELIYKHYSPKRSTFLADMGMLDGELGRVYSYNQNHPDFIRVEESIASIRWMAFTVDPTIQINGWNDLKGTSLKVEYRSGLAEAEHRLSTLVNKDQLSSIKRVPQGLKKLVAGRTDLYIGVKETVMRYMTSDEFSDSEIRIAGMLEEESIHAFLHKKHRLIAPKLSGVLKQMKEEGLLARYRIDIAMQKEKDI